MLPLAVKPLLSEHLKQVREIHQQDLGKGYGRVYLPGALAEKYPVADRQWGWQYAFPASNLSVDPRSGTRCRHHLDESMIQRAVRDAVQRAGVTKQASPHTLRHYVPFLTMSSGLGQQSCSIGRFRSHRGRSEGIARHSLFDPTGC